jgi:hypothetical protein
MNTHSVSTYVVFRTRTVPPVDREHHDVLLELHLISSWFSTPVSVILLYYQTHMWPACLYEDLKDLIRSYLFHIEALDVDPCLFGQKYWKQVPSYWYWHRWVSSLRWSEDSTLSVLTYMRDKYDYLEPLILQFQTLSVNALKQLPLSILLSPVCLRHQDIPIDLLLPHLDSVSIIHAVWYTQGLSFLMDPRVKAWIVQRKVCLPPLCVKERRVWFTHNRFRYHSERVVWPLNLLKEYARYIDWYHSYMLCNLHLPLNEEYILTYGERMPLNYLCSHQQLPQAFLCDQVTKYKGEIPWHLLLCSQRNKNLPDDWLWSWRHAIGFTNWDLFLRNRKLSRSLLIQLSQWRAYWEASAVLRQICHKRRIHPPRLMPW